MSWYWRASESRLNKWRAKGVKGGAHLFQFLDFLLGPVGLEATEGAKQQNPNFAAQDHPASLVTVTGVHCHGGRWITIYTQICHVPSSQVELQVLAESLKPSNIKGWGRELKACWTTKHWSCSYIKATAQYTAAWRLISRLLPGQSTIDIHFWDLTQPGPKIRQHSMVVWQVEPWIDHHLPTSHLLLPPWWVLQSSVWQCSHL